MAPLKRILFLCPYPVGQSPSQRFRFEQYFDFLQANGFSYEVRSFLDLPAWQILYQKGNALHKVFAVLQGFLYRLISLSSINQFDFIFIHREAAPVGPPVLEFIIAKLFRQKIIYDFDDAIWLPNTSEENKMAARLKWHSKVGTICKWSYRVSCGNDYLGNFARRFNANVVSNPTTIDTEILHNPARYPKRTQHEMITIGWTGTHSTLKYLISLVPELSSLEQKFPGKVRFLVIADKDPALNVRSVKFKAWSKTTEIQDLLEIDIGIMPLASDTWAEGKCGFKALQFMALEIPTVASSLGVNSRIIDHGENGYLCNTAEAWITCLEKLIHDKTLREAMGKRGREKVIARYSVSSNSLNFLSLFL